MPVQCFCLLCHAPFVVKPSRKKSGRGTYCSSTCASQHRRRPLVERFWSHVRKTETCWLWQSTLSNRGYGLFSLYGGRQVLTHRFAYELTYGLILPGIHCLHHCDTPGCVRPDHLFLGSHSDNMRDAKKKGRR
jgi:hypothetical protein